MVYLQYERIIRFHHEPGKGHYIIYFTLNERAVIIFEKTLSKACLDLYAGAELAEETHVILEIMTEIVHLPLEHCDTLDTHTERET